MKLKQKCTTKTGELKFGNFDWFENLSKLLNSKLRQFKCIDELKTCRSKA